jgi:predicted lipoprotein with Yx(FWY)xxD motif
MEEKTMRDVRKQGRIFLGVVIGSLLAASFASANTVQTKTKEGLGTYLVDQDGMTLYMFTKDTPDKSACGAANDCLKKWPLFYIGEGGFATGIDAAQLGSLPRDDGKEQSTYKGSPLYYFIKDKAPGDTNGQGVNNSWYVVAP